MTREPSQLPELLERLDAVLLMSDNTVGNATAQPPSIWIVDADPAKSSASLLRRSLAFHGISNACEMTVDALRATDLERRGGVPHLVISLSFMGESLDQNILIEDWCESESMPWVRAVFDLDMGYADVGPIFLAGYTSCYKCFAQLYLKERRNVVTNRAHCSTVAFWCNVLASSLAEGYTQTKHTFTPNGFKRFDLATLERTYFPRTSLPYCRCRRPTPSTKRTIEVLIPENSRHAALVYEDCVGKERPYQASLSTTNRFVSGSLVLKPFPNSASIALAEPSPLENGGADEPSDARTLHRSDSLTLEKLTAILFYSVGLRSVDLSRSAASRWAASAGNLGSPDLFVFANGVGGLPPGLYNYRPLAHELVNMDFRRLSSCCDSLSSLSEGEASLCFTGSYHRLRQKYGAFGYRLVHLDAGVAFSQASLIARSLNVCLTLITDLNEQCVTRHLNLSRHREHLTAVARLSTAEQAHDTRGGHQHHAFPTPIDASLGGLVDTVGQRLSRGLAEALYLESMRTTRSGTSPADRTTHEENPNTLQRSASFPLKQPVNLELMNVLMRRASVRRFARKDVSKDILTALLWLAYEADIAEWPQEHLQRRALQFFLLENTTDGNSALYEYRHSDRSLNFVKAVPRSSTVPPLYVDSCFQDAPAAVWIVGSLEKAIGAHGSYGHRQLLFRSGAAANRLWLRAIKLGIVGTISAGILPRNARQLLDFDGWGKLVLCAFLAGAPANDVLVGK